MSRRHSKTEKTHLAPRAVARHDTLCGLTFSPNSGDRLARGLGRPFEPDDEEVDCGRCRALDASIDRFIRDGEFFIGTTKAMRTDASFNEEEYGQYRDDNDDNDVSDADLADYRATCAAFEEG